MTDQIEAVTESLSKVELTVPKKPRAKPVYEKVTVDMDKRDYERLQRDLKKKQESKEKRSAQGKERWAKKTDEQKKESLDRLAKGRAVASERRKNAGMQVVPKVDVPPVSS